MTAPIAYVFGYGTLADPSDPLVQRAAGAREPIRGCLDGFRRRWNAAVENLAPSTDHKYYVDRSDGSRPDLVVVSLNIERRPGVVVNGIALPIDDAYLRLFDQREHFLERVEVGASFSVPLDLPLWTYTATSKSLAVFSAAVAEGRAVVRRSYIERVEAAFRRLGPEAWRDYERSTLPPECPIADLEIVRAAGDAGI